VIDPVTMSPGQDRARPRSEDILANLAGRYRYGAGLIGVRALSETGDRGLRQGGDLYGERYFLGRRWTALGRVSLYDWDDKLRPDRSGDHRSGT